MNNDSDRSNENGDNKILGKLRHIHTHTQQICFEDEKKQKKKQSTHRLAIQFSCGFHTSYRIEISFVERN